MTATERNGAPHFAYRWATLALALLALGATIAYVQFQNHQSIDTQERERLTVHASIVEKNLLPQLLLANRVIDGILKDLPSWQAQNDGFARANHQLQVINDTLIGIRPILVIRADGTVIASSNATLVGQNFSRRAYFQTAIDNPDPSIFHVSAPFKTVLDTFVISLFRTIRGPNGEFAGIVIVSVVPEYFSILLESVRYAPEVRTSITHGDGKLFMASPKQPETEGMDLAKPGSFFTRHRESAQPANVFTGIAYSTGDQRMMALRTVQLTTPPMDKPLIVGVSRDLQSIFADWRREVFMQGWLFAALVVVASLGLLLYQRRQRAYDCLVADQDAERKQAEEALRESEAYNKILFAGSHIPLAVLDPETGSLVDCNQAAVDIYGLDSREAVLALKPEDVATPLQYDGRSSAETAFEHLEPALRDGSHVFEWRHQRPDGHIWDAEVHLMAFQHKGKSLLQFSLQDISQRKRSEANLRVAATAFESQEGMIITDADQRILRINRACSEITGYSPEEAVGQTPRMFSSGKHDAAFYREMWASIQGSGAWKGELWNRRKNGEVYPEWFSISAVKGDDGKVTNYVASFIDISQRKSAEDEIKHLAFYDPLTGLPNRRLLLDRLRHALAASARNETVGALLFIDLDNFKTLNDTLGHDKGDLLLESVSRRLIASVREHDTVARLGGDEFVVMLENLSEDPKDAAGEAGLVGEKILLAIDEPHHLAGLTHHSTASIGIALFAQQTDTVDELLRRADLAMYQAKAAGRNTLRFFDPEMQASVTARATLDNELRIAVDAGQFLLHYQAQVADDGRLTGAEVLIRWQHPERGMTFPGSFIPEAEETGLILPIGNWVLQTACTQLAIWAKQPKMAQLTLAVNVSALQFRHADFVQQVLAALEHTGANPKKLKLELTESLLVNDVEDIIAKMSALKARGVCFSLDDFGTGYSSLSYLKRLPLDQLKIDQSFVRDILIDPNDAVIAKTIIALADSLGLTVIAEGVETEAQRDFLARQGCLAYQGYLFSHPLALTAFEAFANKA
jgi:diguanylate cyclase (GGDEF)-like protein/PAS domain S-box-containing protein